MEIIQSIYIAQKLRAISSVCSSEEQVQVQNGSILHGLARHTTGSSIFSATSVKLIHVLLSKHQISGLVLLYLKYTTSCLNLISLSSIHNFAKAWDVSIWNVESYKDKKVITVHSVGSGPYLSNSGSSYSGAKHFQIDF